MVDVEYYVSLYVRNFGCIHLRCDTVLLLAKGLLHNRLREDYLSVLILGPLHTLTCLSCCHRILAVLTSDTTQICSCAYTFSA